MSMTALDRLRSADPFATGVAAPEEWRDELLARIGAEPLPTARRSRRAPLVLVAAAILVLLAIPSYGVARDVIQWVRGEPAPPGVVEEFDRYTPQLGYQPDPGGAVLVAVEGDVRLYSTKNDKGSYCLVLTAPGRPTGDGGTCINPDWAKEPLIAGGLGTAHNEERSWTQFVGGRSDHPSAHSISFADPAGEPMKLAVGFDGFFVGAVPISSTTCVGGDWRPAMSVLDAKGNEVARAEITLLFSDPEHGVCGFSPPHPPDIR
jgi:hypothetical protein